MKEPCDRYQIETRTFDTDTGSWGDWYRWTSRKTLADAQTAIRERQESDARLRWLVAQGRHEYRVRRIVGTIETVE